MIPVEFKRVGSRYTIYPLPVKKGDSVSQIRLTTPSPEDVEKGRSPKGGWTRATLESWGISWPPKKGWKSNLRDQYLKENGFIDKER